MLRPHWFNHVAVILGESDDFPSDNLLINTSKTIKTVKSSERGVLLVLVVFTTSPAGRADKAVIFRHRESSNQPPVMLVMLLWPTLTSYRTSEFQVQNAAGYRTTTLMPSRLPGTNAIAMNTSSGTGNGDHSPC